MCKHERASYRIDSETPLVMRMAICLLVPTRRSDAAQTNAPTAYWSLVARVTKHSANESKKC